MTNDAERIKQILLSSKQLAQEQIDRLYGSDRITFAFLNECMTACIQAKFMLEPEECEGVDFQKLSELSLSKSMKISPELVKEFDMAKSCDGVSSAMAKKVLLFLSIQKQLQIELPAKGTATLKTLDELADLAWNEMIVSPVWQQKISGF